VTTNQIAQLRGVIESWLREKGVNNSGIVLTVNIMPPQVLVSAPRKKKKKKSKKFGVKELSEVDWDTIFHIASSSAARNRERLVDALRKLKARNNEGLADSDFPEERGGQRFMEKFNALSHRHGSLYRVVYPWGRMWTGPYRIGVRT